MCWTQHARAADPRPHVVRSDLRDCAVDAKWYRSLAARAFPSLVLTYRVGLAAERARVSSPTPTVMERYLSFFSFALRWLMLTSIVLVTCRFGRLKGGKLRDSTTKPNSRNREPVAIRKEIALSLSCFYRRATCAMSSADKAVCGSTGDQGVPVRSLDQIFFQAEVVGTLVPKHLTLQPDLRPSCFNPPQTLNSILAPEL